MADRISSPWPTVPLKDVTTKVGSGATPRGGKEVYRDTGTAFIRSQNIYDNQFSFGGLARISDEAAEALRGVEVLPGDVLINITGESVTRTAMVPDAALPARVSQHVAIVRPDQSVLDTRFLLSALLNPPTKSYLNMLSEAGATRRALTKSHIEKTTISLPPLDEQRRIAGVLGALDDLIDTNRRQLSKLAEVQTAVFLTSWTGESRRLGSVAQITMGQSPPGTSYNEDGEGMTFYQGVRDFGWRYPTRRVWTTAPTRIAEAGDVLVAVRAPVGETNVAVETTALGRGLAGVRAPERQATLLQALTADPRIWDFHQGTGTVFAAINKQGLNDLQVPWVDSDGLESKLSTLDTAIRELDEEIANLTKARDELLPLLLSGRVRVSESLAVA